MWDLKSIILFMCSMLIVILISVKSAQAGEPENKSITPKEFVTTVSEVPGKVGNFLTNEVFQRFSPAFIHK